MTLDGFLTFLALIAAAYAIVSNVDRLRLRLHTTRLVIISLFGFAVVIYFEYFSLLALPCPKSFGDYCRFLLITQESQVSAGQAAFAIVILWLLLVWAILMRRTISPRALPVLSQLVSELVYTERFTGLVALVEPHIDLLNRASETQLKWSRLREWLLELDSDNVPFYRRALSEGKTAFSERSRVHKALAVAAGKIAQLVPTESMAEDAADEIFRVLFQLTDFVRFVALSRPRLAVKLLSCSIYEVEDFCTEYMTALILNVQSTLYTEVRQNQDILSGGSYDFPEYNALLHFLFSDARNAQKLGVWKPVGEHLLSSLRLAHRS
jgi:hypothetical protein